MTSNSLTQSLLDLESNGATGRLTITSDQRELGVLMSHGRLALDNRTGDLGEAGRARLYNHGFDVDDRQAATVAAIDDLTESLTLAIKDDSATWLFEESAETASVTTLTTAVVRDARRRVAEDDRLLILVPGDDAVADRVRGADTSNVHLSRLLGNVYAAVDGSRTITDLGRDLGVGPAAARRSLFRLTSLGLVRFDRTVIADQPASAPSLNETDWAESTLADAIEEPEPWIGFARGGGPDVSPPKRRPRGGAPSVVEAAEADEAVTVGAAPTPRVEPPSRSRPIDAEERRESLRQAAAWLADIDHDDATSPEPEPVAAAPASAAPTAPAQRTVPAERPAPPAEDVSDFLRELSQLSRDDD